MVDLTFDFRNGYWDPSDWFDYNRSDETYLQGDDVGLVIGDYSDPIHKSCAIGQNIFYDPPSGSVWYLRFRSYIYQGDDTKGFGAYIKNGNNYIYLGEKWFDYHNTYYAYRINKNRPRPPLLLQDGSGDNTNREDGIFYNMALRFNIDKTIDIINKPDGGAWILVALNIGSWENKPITEIGVVADVESDMVTTGPILALTDLTLEGVTARYESYVGGSATLTKAPYGIILNKGLHGVSSAMVSFQERFLQNYATHEANHGETVDIYMRGGTMIMHSELRNPSHQAHNVIYSLKPYGLKLNEMMIGLNPLYNAVVLRCLDWDDTTGKCYFRDKDFTFDEDWIGKMTIFTQLNTKKLTYNLDFDKHNWIESKYNTGTSEWDETEITPDDESGDMAYVYYQDTDEANNGIHGYYEQLTTQATRFGLDGQYNVFLKDGSLPTKLEVSMVFAVRQLSQYGIAGSTQFPTLEFYNFSTLDWDVIKTVETSNLEGGNIYGQKLSNDGFGFSESNNITVTATVESTTIKNDYFQLQNNNDFDEYTMKVRVMTGSKTTSGFDHTIHLYHSYIDITLDEVAIMEYGQGYISDVSDASKYIEFATNTFLPDLPSQDGICNSDVMYIVDNLDDLIIRINEASTYEYMIRMNITDSDQITITQDLTYMSYKQFLNTINKLTNSIWWVDDDERLIHIRTMDNLDDSGVTIAQSNIYNGRNGIFYDEDSSYLASKLVLQGKGVTYEKGLSPEFTLEGDDETKIIRETKADTQDKVISIVNQTYPMFESVHRLMKFALAWNVTQYANALKIGRLITVQIPNSSSPILDYSGANKLLIYKMEYIKQIAGREFVILWLQRRFY